MWVSLDRNDDAYRTIMNYKKIVHTSDERTDIALDSWQLIGHL